MNSEPQPLNIGLVLTPNTPPLNKTKGYGIIVGYFPELTPGLKPVEGCRWIHVGLIAIEGLTQYAKIPGIHWVNLDVAVLAPSDFTAPIGTSVEIGKTSSRGIDGATLGLQNRVTPILSVWNKDGSNWNQSPCLIQEISATGCPVRLYHQLNSNSIHPSVAVFKRLTSSVFAHSIPDTPHVAPITSTHSISSTLPPIPSASLPSHSIINLSAVSTFYNPHPDGMIDLTKIEKSLVNNIDPSDRLRGIYDAHESLFYTSIQDMKAKREKFLETSRQYFADKLDIYDVDVLSLFDELVFNLAKESHLPTEVDEAYREFFRQGLKLKPAQIDELLKRPSLNTLSNVGDYKSTILAMILLRLPYHDAMTIEGYLSTGSYRYDMLSYIFDDPFRFSLSFGLNIVTAQRASMIGKALGISPSPDGWERDLLIHLKGYDPQVRSGRNSSTRDTLPSYKYTGSIDLPGLFTKGFVTFMTNSMNLSLEGSNLKSSLSATDSHSSIVKADTHGIIMLVDDEFWCPFSVYEGEFSLIMSLIRKSLEPTGVSDDEIFQTLEDFEATRFKLEPLQREGIYLVKNQVGVLAGCAGSGKTTVSQIMIPLLESKGYEILFAAPTGKAAARLAEVVERPVKTLHSTFRIVPGVHSDKIPFSSTTSLDIELPGKVAFILDEMAMSDTNLLSQVIQKLNASGSDYAIYFLGDPKQLPPIGQGNPFYTFMHSLPTIELGVSKRAGEGSTVTYNCDLINHMSSQSSKVTLPNGSSIRGVLALKDDDHFVLWNKSDVGIVDGIMYTLERFLSEYSPDQIQVLTPYATPSRSWSSTNLNPKIQKVVNPNGKGYDVSNSNTGERYLVGDRVIITQNNSDIRRYQRDEIGNFIFDHSGVLNGEIGTILEFTTLEKLVIAGESPSTSFDDIVVLEMEDGDFVLMGWKISSSTGKITRKGDMSSVQLAYALTIHKSQGSQYPLVIVPIGETDSPSFVNRNMIYTAISRSSDRVVMIGSVKGATSALNRCRQTVEKPEDELSLMSLVLNGGLG